MLDVKFIRENRDKVIDNSANKNIDVDVDKLLELDEKKRDLTTKIEELRAVRNKLSTSMKGSGKPSDEVLAKSKELKSEIQKLESELEPTDRQLIDLLKQVPNMSSEDTPVGNGEEDNQVVYEKGDKPEFDFEVKNHWDIAKERGWIDKERAAKVSGARFAYIKGELVKLQMAIISYTIDKLTDESVIKQIIDQVELKNLSSKPFTPILPPYMIRTDLFDAMDRLEPREDRYKIEGEELWLQGSAEHVMGSMHHDEIIEKEDLPLRYLGFATSFRKEAGSYGKDLEGIIRMHQFDKLEMEIIATAETGLEEHLLTIAVQEYLMNDLQIPYRKLIKCTADIGKPNARGIDLDAWLPGQSKYRETHTADYMTDYQARRLNTRTKIDGQSQFVYTIDATAFALGRTIVAIIENNQTKEGKVRIPTALQNYMGGEEEI